mmetsp:Transcript_58068/g.126129  ORF Transcript_58068/g.126129 Transcript_58068/m.126129 type:complete len:253 (-) Transcript_58068:342-1100(-)
MTERRELPVEHASHTRLRRMDDKVAKPVVPMDDAAWLGLVRRLTQSSESFSKSIFETMHALARDTQVVEGDGQLVQRNAATSRAINITAAAITNPAAAAAVAAVATSAAAAAIAIVRTGPYCLCPCPCPLPRRLDDILLEHAELLRPHAQLALGVPTSLAVALQPHRDHVHPVQRRKRLACMFPHFGTIGCTERRQRHVLEHPSRDVLHQVEGHAEDGLVFAEPEEPWDRHRTALQRQHHSVLAQHVVRRRK